MRAEGVDLSQFNSVASALDVHDLRRALDYEEWNLFGVSYGSRLALEALRVARQGIRSVVLDGPSPPNVDVDAELNVSFADVVHRLASACAADARCGAAYPDLENRIWRKVEALHAEPWYIPGGERIGLPDPIVFDGSLFAGAVFQWLYRPELLPLTPVFVEQIERRNAALVLALVEPLGSAVRDTDHAMNLAVECFETVPFFNPAARQAQRGRYAAILDRIGFGVENGTVEMCDAWHPFRATPELGHPVRSDVPTLVFTGEYDPVTHRRFAALAVEGLTNAHVLDIPAMGHVAAPFHECTRTMVAAFFADPAAPPDRRCIHEEMQPLRFVSDVRVVPAISRHVGMLSAGGGSKITGLAAGLPLVVLLGSLVGWPVAAGVGRMRGSGRPVRTPFERRARQGAAAFALLAVGFAAALTWTVVMTAAQNPAILLFGLPAWAAPLLAIPWILGAGSIALAAAAVLASQRGAWTRWGRIHYTLVAAAGVLLAATLLGIALA